jgi:hypothetical protein
MDDKEIERKIRQAGYDLRWESAPDGGGNPMVFALRDGKPHTRPFPSLLELAEYVGRVERPVRFIDDRDVLDSAIASHALVTGHFAVRPAACRIAEFNGLKYVELVSMARDATAMYEVRPDGLRKMSNGNLPPEIVAAFDRAPRPREQS